MSSIKFVQQSVSAIVFVVLFGSSLAFGNIGGSSISSTNPSTRFDFDGDGKADISVFRPANGRWYLNRSRDGFDEFQFGQNGDEPVAADYDGDGKTDAAIYRSGTWYRKRSATNTVDSFVYGISGDIPSPADFDGDGRADIAVFRPSTGQYFWIRSSNGHFGSGSIGSDNDTPIAGDYDGDGRADMSVFRQSDGTWHRINSSNGGQFVQQFGVASDKALLGDFDGDAKSDLAVWRPSNGEWHILGSMGSYTVTTFGLPTDVPVPADYDGDGRADIAVYRPSTGVWYRLDSSTGALQTTLFGLSSDLPVPIINSPPPPPAPPAGSFTCNYYASPTGAASGSGSIGNPWDLQTALGKTSLIRDGKTLCLRGGRYSGKFTSSLTGGGIVRSAPSEWAKIDGYKTMTLVAAMNASQTTFNLTSTSGILDGGPDNILIGREVIQVHNKNGNTVTGSLRGASGSLNGAEPHPAGSTVIIAGSTFHVTGSNTIYRDFEVTNSRPSRDGNVENQEIGRGNGIGVVGDGNKLINLIIHDNLSGIFTSGTSSNTEIYGCLIYNNGAHARPSGSQEEGYGHGLYVENRAGYSKIYEDIVLNNFNLGMQGYGVTAPYVGGDVRGSIFANSGSPLGKFGDVNRRNWNIIIGPDSQRSPTANLQNSHTYHPPSSNGYSVNFGYGAGVVTGTIRDNHFVGGGTLFIVGNTSNATITGNQFYSSRSGATYVISPNGMPYAWNNNTYHASNGRNVFGVASVGTYLFPAWKSATGFDSNSTSTGSAMPDKVIVSPNAYQPGRANVMIYNFSGSPSVSVDLSTTGLAHGQPFTIRNAQNYFGKAAANGVYNSQSPIITVPLTTSALTVAAPYGYSFTPATTCPQFCPMIVVPNKFAQS